jgi:hypothetical protein
MDKKWIFRGLMIAGGIYVWALIPVNIRPQIPRNPIRKSEQTITVNVDSPNETHVPWDAAERVQAACRPPVLLRPFEDNAATVRVLLRYRTNVVEDVHLKCAAYK